MPAREQCPRKCGELRCRTWCDQEGVTSRQEGRWRTCFSSTDLEARGGGAKASRGAQSRLQAAPAEPAHTRSPGPWRRPGQACGAVHTGTGSLEVRAGGGECQQRCHVQCLGTQSSRTVVLWEDRGWAGPSTKRNCVNGVLRQEDTRLSGDTRSPWEGRVSAVTEKGWGLNPEGLWDGAR